jgi:hypothetical protein
MPNTLEKKETIHVQCIKFGISHEQCPTCRPVSSINSDVRGLAGIAPWSQKNDTPHNTVKPTTSCDKWNIDTKEMEGDRKYENTRPQNHKVMSSMIDRTYGVS